MITNFNNWTGDLRTIARKATCNRKPIMQEKDIINTFSQMNFESSFQQGMTPQEAFDAEMEEWQYNQ